MRPMARAARSRGYNHTGSGVMRVRCYLRAFRGNRSIRELERATGIHRGTLSLIEHGRLFPLDAQIPVLEREYGAECADWYGTDLEARRLLLALAFDNNDEAAA